MDALLVGIVRNPVVRCELLDAFQEHGFLAGTAAEPETAVDGLGRFRKTRFNKALEAFDENLRSRVVSLLEHVNAFVQASRSRINGSWQGRSPAQFFNTLLRDRAFLHAA